MITIRTMMMIMLFPLSVSGLEITEVMYDPVGPDSGREWVEILNTGNDINLSEYRFYEAGVHHMMTLWQGDEILSNGSFAIIADRPEKFLVDYPWYTGTLFDSSWGSLSNDGETIGISKAGEMIVLIEYDKTWMTSGTPGYIETPSVPEFSLGGIIAILIFAFLAYRR